MTSPTKEYSSGKGLRSLFRLYSGLSSTSVNDENRKSMISDDTSKLRRSLSNVTGRPRMERGESSKVNFDDVYQTLKRHGGRIDIEQEFKCLGDIQQSSSRRFLFPTNKEVQDAETQTHFPLGTTRSIDEVPIGAIYATICLSWNSVIMLITEVVIEILIVVGLYPKLPLRIAFLFLTLLSGVLGAQTLVAVRRKEFDTSQNALQIGLIVELALIIGDLEFLLSKYRTKYPASLPTRLPFMILTTVNVILIGFLYTRLKLYEQRTTHQLPELVRPVELGLGTVTEYARALLPPISRVRASTWTLDDLGIAVVRHVETQERQQLLHLPTAPSPPPSPKTPRLSCTAAGCEILNLCPNDVNETCTIRSNENYKEADSHQSILLAVSEEPEEEEEITIAIAHSSDSKDEEKSPFGQETQEAGS
mmetsp:Transcript_18402/g.27717  ORF Transcript_18402/g.27717 Transcript_18402/m.27717 type:complete len:420 (-) Transcript_18402:406-1665(-)|eukprot:CAMPEP_0197320948 /NCGR_PEP_ID=MMETSP0891-20130614/62435_1 /TAXON_ID=44058 ORGANISM="Aureoumbra lagunensis, Strain CCMP1510" /NCGR_SAMPLE_ID=MMETSP0891 /ASSEMBLY_ACC=CAM_ASM_000534 /LENGTH=419 /DNA_ID=CAMNT_0042812563 /DNA_START=22 /DNA_END=1281 /DNA_ORIENTATION=+